jgi:hypothetical protein
LIAAVPRRFFLLGWLLPAMFWTAAAAQADGARLGFEMSLAGLPTGSMDAEIRLAPERYELAAQGRARGIVELVTGYVGRAESAGRRDGLRPLPGQYSVRARSMGKARTVDATWTPERRMLAQVTPSAEADDREPVPESLQYDVVDPLSAALSIVESKCTGRLQVFDGRRRLEMVLAEGGIETVDEPLYRGPAQRCHLTIISVAGRSRRSWFPRRTTPDEADIWLAAMWPGLPAVPVRVESDTLLGTLVVQLREAVRLPDPSVVR